MRGLIALLLTLGVATAWAKDNIEEPVAQAVRGSIEAMHDTHSRASTIAGLSTSQAIAKFYEVRAFTQAWGDAAIVEQLFTEIDKLHSDGLEPDDYQLSTLRARFRQLPSADINTADAITQRADFDILATRAYLISLAHLFRGKVNPAALDPEWNFTRNNLALNEAMKIVNDGIENRNLAAVYERARPQHPLYDRARSGLAQLRAIAAHSGWPKLADKPTLKPGMTDPQIAVLRRRLSPVTTDTTINTAPDELYDATLVAAVRKFQREQYLDDDGIVGRATRAALNIPVQERIDQVRVNLERERWLLHEFKNDFVLVDIAGFKIYFFKDGQPIWRSKVQVGRPIRSSPIFKAKITHLTFNPTWTVPPTIFRKDVVPKVKQDLGYLTENNIRVLDSRGRELDPKKIDWNNPGDIILRQDAGDDAALGQVAIRFPNPYSVYLHDTPHRELFATPVRAFSSGCIRVERPLELVELLFNDPVNWNRAAIEAFIAQGETRNVNLPKPVPILLAYWTIDLLNDGTIGFKPDIYERDYDVLKALNARL